MKFLKSLILAVIIIPLAACSDANVASANLSKAADNFEIQRRVTFYNGITGDAFLTMEGLCSLGNFDSVGQLSVTCKDGPNSFKKHFLGLSDNVTYVAEQIESAPGDVYHYRVVFKPSVLIPNIQIK